MTTDDRVPRVSARQRLTRVLILFLLLLIGLLLWLSYNPPILQTLLIASGYASVEPTRGPTPLPPTITAPRGDLPAGHAGLQEWAQDTGGAIHPVGCGFLLRLENGEVIGVATAHSTADLSGYTRRSLERIALHLPGQREALIEFDTFYGPPGQVFTGYRFSMDYKLLQATQPILNSLALRPDPRGAPQPGERVTLFSGLGDGASNPRLLAGTVTTVDPDAIWVQMDDAFDPSGMSGSPLLSQHTGKVVGMAVSASFNAPVMLGFHPIGSIVHKAEAAHEFPGIAAYEH